MSFVHQIEQDLNKIRTVPNSNVRIYKNMKLTLERIKKPLLSKECGKFEEWLKTAQPIGPLEVSEGLIKAANSRLDAIEILGRQEKLSQQSLHDLIRKYTKKVINPFELTDNGAQEPEEVLSRLMMHEEDTERINRKIVFDAEIKYFGVAHREISDDKHITIIIFANFVEEREDFPIQIDLLERINRIRENPNLLVSEAEIFMKIQSRKKKQQLFNQCQGLIEDLKKQKAKKPIKSSKILDEIANYFIEGIKKISHNSLIGPNELQAISEELNYGEYSLINGIGIYDNGNVDKIIFDLMVNEYDIDNTIRNVIFNDKVKIIGISHQQINYVPITIFIFCDHINLVEKTLFDEKILIELNSIRRNPKSLIPKIELMRKNIVKTPENQIKINKLEDLIKILINEGKIPEFIMKNCLCKASEDFLLQHSETNSIFEKRIFSEDKEFLGPRLAQYCQGFNEVYQYVESVEANNLIIRLLTDDFYSPEKSFKNILFNKNLIYLGVAQQEIMEKKFISIIFADQADKIEEKGIDENLFEYINIIRSNPRSFIHHFQKMLVETKVDRLNERIKKIIHFLRNTRYFITLRREKVLDDAAYERINIISKNKGKYEVQTKSELREYLNNYCCNNEISKEIIFPFFENPLDFLIQIMINPDFEFENSAIFDQKFTSIGIAVNKDKNISVLYFTNQVNEKEQMESSSCFKKTNRPYFTQDEINQLMVDFNKFDNLKKGYIQPQYLLPIIENHPGFKNKNPIYYEVILNASKNEVYSKKGINKEDFIQEVIKVVSEYSEQNWKHLFDIYVGESKKRVIDSYTLKNISESLGINLDEDKCQDIIKRISEGKKTLDLKTFSEIMIIVENQGRAYPKN